MNATPIQGLVHEGISLTHGGPFHSLQERLRLLPRRPQTLGVRTPGAAVLLTWLPLVLLALPGWLRTGDWDPLLLRAEVHFRLLGALLLFFYGDNALGERVRPVMRAVFEAQLLSKEGQGRLFDRIARLIRLRDARAPEAGMMAVAWAASLASFLGTLPPWAPRWVLGSHGMGGSWSELSPASWWYVLISQPVFLFVLLRWTFHWGLWASLLHKLAKLGPDTRPSHADGAGGLAFLAEPLFALRILSMGLSLAITGVWLDEIALNKVDTNAFVRDVTVVVGVMTLLALLPYLPFTRVLVEAKQAGEIAYSQLMRRYVERFDARWLGADARGRDLLGHADFSGLADLSSGFETVKKMRVTPLGGKDLKALLIATALPFVLIPLVFGKSTQELIQGLVMRLLAA